MWIVLLGLHFGFNMAMSLFMLFMFYDETTVWEKIGIFLFGWMVLVYKTIEEEFSLPLVTEFEKEQKKNNNEKVGV